MIIKEKVDGKKDGLIDKLKDEFIETQQAVSKLKKKGKDTKIAELLLIDIPAKIKMAKISYADEDFSIVKKKLGQVKKEIEEVTVGSDFDTVNQLIKGTFEHLRKDERKKAIEKYNEIRKMYKLLTNDLRKTVYSACVELNDRLTKNE